MSSADELDAIRARYARRNSLPPDRYSRFNADVLARVHERQRVMLALMASHGVRSLAGVDVLEVGCGNGANLLELLELGAEPQRIVGNELLPDRMAKARLLLPDAVRLLPGDAAGQSLSDASFDIVLQSTVFSSILDDALQQRVAAAMWRWVRPGGGVLWYDFVYDNPRNPDVRGVPLKRVRELFPQGRIDARRITLAPPIARRVVRLHPSLYTAFNTIPWLRTHVLAWIAKPAQMP
jgi:SAM-dependent methyltransferase